MNADYPYKNPFYKGSIPGSKQVLLVTNQSQKGSQVWLVFEDQGNTVVNAYLMYTRNGGQKYEEWFRMDASIKGGQVSANLPSRTTHYIFNLIDEKNFLVSYSPRFNEYIKSLFSKPLLFSRP